VSQIVDGQVRALRKRQLIGGFTMGLRLGTYWGVRSEQRDYGLADPFPLDPVRIANAASVPTRLARLDLATQRDLVDWGYVIADTAYRRWVDRSAPAPVRLPMGV
jgi:NTE family protein